MTGMSTPYHRAALVALALSTACGLSARQAETAALEATNAAIVSAARDVDAREAAEERACSSKPPADVPACVTRARRWGAALEAYEAWRVAWAALRALWNDPAATTADVAAAQGKLEQAKARFWIARELAEAGGSR